MTEITRVRDRRASLSKVTAAHHSTNRITHTPAKVRTTYRLMPTPPALVDSKKSLRSSHARLNESTLDCRASAGTAPSRRKCFHRLISARCCTRSSVAVKEETTTTLSNSSGEASAHILRRNPSKIWEHINHIIERREIWYRRKRRII